MTCESERRSHRSAHEIFNRLLHFSSHLLSFLSQSKRELLPNLLRSVVIKSYTLLTRQILTIVNCRRRPHFQCGIERKCSCEAYMQRAQSRDEQSRIPMRRELGHTVKEHEPSPVSNDSDYANSFDNEKYRT